MVYSFLIGIKLTNLKPIFDFIEIKLKMSNYVFYFTNITIKYVWDQSFKILVHKFSREKMRKLQQNKAAYKGIQRVYEGLVLHTIR